ncbi:uncharacterized protein PGTG_16411 [Puccinia graminis f. sp. tritici CRL 75-36-700-3]|uniref:Uncharacterized protein n=1 Tax=Puccinia graminis f. sp. tritici (strain CRL 75-36-700-3 / race SCCL) TaxID=418459 RepID=E3L3U5_PUCGT|nr:uncharacterized protein PGTG_16411 [Puccinia graminis f. sp. tritici CRL 75-36-700-3]EFP91220.2 hypothetical protein PGTG_16411 [Puccinia graminis f. sp. tritici CRL 75-36-700-3]
MSNEINSPITPLTTAQSNETVSDPAQSSNSTSTLTSNSQDPPPQRSAEGNPSGNPNKRGLPSDNVNPNHAGTESETQQAGKTAALELARRLGTNNDTTSVTDDEVRVIKAPKNLLNGSAKYQHTDTSHASPPRGNPTITDSASFQEDEAIASLIEKCLAATKAGDMPASDRYYEMYKSLLTAKAKSKIPRGKRTSDNVIADSQQSSDEDSMAGDVQFATGAIPKHDENGFHPILSQKHQNDERTDSSDNL